MEKYKVLEDCTLSEGNSGTALTAGQEVELTPEQATELEGKVEKLEAQA